MDRKLTWLSSVLVSVFCGGTAFAQATMPMKYFDDPRVNYGDGTSRVIVGARVSADASSELQVEPAGLLYVAPGRAKVTASGFQLYGNANCAVIRNERANEAVVSDLVAENLRQIKNYQEDLNQLNDESRKSTKECLQATREGRPNRNELCDYTRTVRTSIKELGESLAPWSDQINQAAADVAKRLDDYGRQPGGFAAATVSLFDPEELRKVRELNPGMRVDWVPLRDVSFSFTPSQEDIDASIPMRTTLGFSLAGGPSTEGGSGAATTAIRSGGDVALGITLSRLGACDPSLLRAAAFFYKFDSFAFVKGSAMINTWAAYERVEENSTSGGFFTTRAVHKLYEDLQSGRVANISVVGTGAADEQQMRERLEATILQDLISQMADAKTLTSPATSVIGLPTPGQSGATILGDSLQRCPHIYCQVGGFVLKGLAAIFGSTSSREEIKRKFNHKVQRTFGFTTKLDDFGGATTLVQWMP